ncbi:MAG TPA: 16S rRNA (cytidine(1402)-2'-O)-methyltransferase [Saprospiraceae bacterium]|nr:16S rRNA (cytidine(1402)-2'-O)-methyltransferase [Saprospiraceae bacterium]
MLYVVPTPIGHLDDLTLRARQVLSEVNFIICEDTRVTGRLLKHYEIEQKLVSNHIHNEHKVLTGLVKRLQAGESAALVSDAGLPALSDPGYLLIRECIKEKIKLTVLPGANAALTAAIGSGIPCDRFFFQGFLPPKKGRQSRLQWLAALQETIVLYESPHRILKTLQHLIEHFGPDCQACIAREMTKLHEEYSRGSLSEMLADYKSRPSIKGEIVVVVNGKETQLETK